MAALIDISNRALGYLGAEALVSLDQSTPLAAKIKILWPQVRDDVLRDHPWNCCQRRVRLARLADNPAFGFSYQFQLPSDFLRLVDTWPSLARCQVEGQKMLSDCPELALLYVFREENPQNYDSQLAAVMSIKLASELAYGITSSTSLAQSLDGLYLKKIKDAKSVNARESDTDFHIRPSHWLAAFRGG